MSMQYMWAYSNIFIGKRKNEPNEEFRLQDKTVYSCVRVDMWHRTDSHHIKKNQKTLTRKAIFLSLFMAENCFRRDRTAEPKGLSGATLSLTIQGWPISKEKQLLRISSNIKNTEKEQGAINAAHIALHELLFCFLDPCRACFLSSLLHYLISEARVQIQSLFSLSIFA